MTENAPKKSRKWLWIVGGIILLLIIIGSMGSEDGKPTATAEQPASAAPPVQVTSNELGKAFEENEVAAKAKYEGKRLAVTGTIQSIELDFADDPVVNLRGANEFSNVLASFDKSQIAQTGALKKGQKVTVTCNEISEALGSPILKDCTL